LVGIDRNKTTNKEDIDFYCVIMFWNTTSELYMIAWKNIKIRFIKKNNDHNIPRKFRIQDFLLSILPPCMIIITGARQYGLSQCTLAAQQQQNRSMPAIHASIISCILI